MITGQLFNLEARYVWNGISGTVYNKALEAIEKALQPALESGDAVNMTEGSGKALVVDGTGYRLEIHALAGKSNNRRPFVLTAPDAFKAETGVDFAQIEGVIVTDRK